MINVKENFLYALRAILPILLIILLGYLVRRIASWPDKFYKTINQLCFRLFLPIHLFCNIYSVKSLSDINWKVACFLFFSVFLCFALGVLFSHLFIPDRRQKGVIVQASFRSNQAILGLPLANALGGQPALAFASTATALCIPLYNALAVVTLALYSNKINEKVSVRDLVRRVISNPLIIASLSSLLLVLIRQILPTIDGVPFFTIQNQLPSVYQALTNLSRIASPLMLFVLGTQLDLSAVSGLLPQLRLGVLMRLIICPVVVLGLALLLREPLSLTTLEMPTLIAVCSTPVAVASVVMVQEIGGDDQLASQLVVWTSFFAMFSLFCIIYLMRFWGFL